MIHAASSTASCPLDLLLEISCVETNPEPATLRLEKFKNDRPESTTLIPIIYSREFGFPTPHLRNFLRNDSTSVTVACHCISASPTAILACSCSRRSVEFHSHRKASGMDFRCLSELAPHFAHPSFLGHLIKIACSICDSNTKN